MPIVVVTLNCVRLSLLIQSVCLYLKFHHLLVGISGKKQAIIKMRGTKKTQKSSSMVMKMRNSEFKKC